MNVLRKQAQLTAPQVAYRWLHEAITTLPSDEEAFFSENTVAEASGTSRTPVREALLRLEAEGLLRRVPNKGAFVPALSEKDIGTMMEARRVIEEWAVRRFTEAADDTAKLEELLTKQAEILTDPLAFIQCDIEFHKHIVSAAKNPILEDLYESLRFKQLRLGVRAVLDSEGREDRVLLEHRAIVRGIQSGNALVAVNAIDDHLSSTLHVLTYTDGT